MASPVGQPAMKPGILQESRALGWRLVAVAATFALWALADRLPPRFHLVFEENSEVEAEEDNDEDEDEKALESGLQELEEAYR